MIKVHVLDDETKRFQVYGRARIREKSVKVYVGTFASQRDAEAADEEHRVTQRGIKAGDLPPAVDQKRTLGDALDAWLKAIADQRSHDEYESRMRLYPDHFRDYSKLSVQRGDAYGNARRAVMFERLRRIDKIGKPVDHGEWFVTPATVDAYYDKSMNDINFPAAILQSPLYDANAADAVNYGHIGSIVGHELTHGFDDRGRKFDANGNLADWWTAADAKEFDEKEQCFVDEYNDFIAVDDLHINGKLTLGENTADNGGLRLAYRAFLIDAKRKHIDVTRKQADGFTPIQEFFIGYGQDFCGGTRPEQRRVQVQTDPHSPSQFRVDGTVRNMPEFGTAFGCRLGQPMMPKKVCRMW